MRAIFFFTRSKLPQRLIELAARVGVLNLPFADGSTGRAGAAGAERCTPKVEYGERDPKSFAQRTENVLLRHAHVVEAEATRRSPTNAKFRHARFDHFKAFHLWRNEEGSNGILVLAWNWCAYDYVRTCAIEALVM